MTSTRVILIVDDVDQVGSVAAEYLERRVPHVQVVEFTDPEEALRWLKVAPQVDLVLSDYHMGETDGLAFIEQARALHPRALFALMTAYLDLPVAPEELGRRGIHAVLRKPWQWADFARFMQELVDTPPAAKIRLQERVIPSQFPEGAFQEFAAHRLGIRPGASATEPPAEETGRAPAAPLHEEKKSPDAKGAPVRRDPETGQGYVKCPHCEGLVEVALPPAQEAGSTAASHAEAPPETPSRSLAPTSPSSASTPLAEGPLTDEEAAERILEWFRLRPRVAVLVHEHEADR